MCVWRWVAAAQKVIVPTKQLCIRTDDQYSSHHDIQIVRATWHYKTDTTSELQFFGPDPEAKRPNSVCPEDQHKNLNSQQLAAAQIARQCL